MKKKTKRTKKKQPEEPALSAKIALVMETEAPRQAWAEHRLLGNCFEVTEAKLRNFERGKAIHNMVLEGGNKIVRIGAATYQANYAKAARDLARKKGQIPILEVEAEELDVVAYTLSHTIHSMGYVLSEGIAEKKIHWHEASTLGPVLCSSIIDWHTPGGVIIDVKTTEGSVHPEQCALALTRGSGSIQDCAYRSALCAKDPGLVGRTDVIFFFGQSRPPYMVTPVRCTGSMRRIGEGRWLRAIETWAQCLAKGRLAMYWPQHTDRPIDVDPPAWELAREVALEEFES